MELHQFAIAPENPLKQLQHRLWPLAIVIWLMSSEVEKAADQQAAEDAAKTMPFSSRRRAWRLSPLK